MLTGAHSIIYSTNAEADRAFLRDVLELTNVDVGHGWLIFGLPLGLRWPCIPPTRTTSTSSILICDDVKAFVAQMGRHSVACEAVQDQDGGC